MNRNVAVRKARLILHKRAQIRNVGIFAIWQYGEPEPAKANFLVKVGFPQPEFNRKLTKDSQSEVR